MASVTDTCMYQLPCDLRVWTPVQIRAPFSCSGSGHHVPPQTCLPSAGCKILSVPKQTPKLTRLQRPVKVTRGGLHDKINCCVVFPPCLPKQFQFCTIPSGQVVNFPLIISFFSIPLPLMSLLQGGFKHRCASPSPLLKWDPFIICWTAESPVWHSSALCSVGSGEPQPLNPEQKPQIFAWFWDCRTVSTTNMIRSTLARGPNDLTTFLDYTENQSYHTFIGLCGLAHLLSLLLLL